MIRGARTARAGTGIILGLSLAALLGCTETRFRDVEPETRSTTTVERISTRESVTVSGNIAAYRSRNLGFSSSERITSIDTAEGRWVPAGTILARVDASSAEFAVAAKEYELEQASFSESPRRIELLRRELDSLRAGLEERVITAPFDGVVAKINQREGEIAGGERALLQFIDTAKLKASVVVDELDVARLRVGQEAVFSFDALPGEIFPGRVERVAPIGRLNQRGLPVIDVDIVIEDPDPRIIIPYSFQADIIVTDAADFLVLDERAVVWRDDAVFATLVDRENPDRTIERPIRIRPWRDGTVIVIAGLEEGDEVLMQQSDFGFEEFDSFMGF